MAPGHSRPDEMDCSAGCVETPANRLSSHRIFQRLPVRIENRSGYNYSTADDREKSPSDKTGLKIRKMFSLGFLQKFQFLTEFQKHRIQIQPGRCQCSMTRNQNNIPTLSKPVLIQPINFPQTATSTIPDHSVSQFHRDRYAQAIMPQTISTAINHHTARDRGSAFSIQKPELVIFFQCHRRFHRHPSHFTFQATE